MDELEDRYTMKGVGTPMYYLGGDVEVIAESWSVRGVSTALSAKTYINQVVPKIEKRIGKDFPKAKTSMAEGAHPELDDSSFLNAEGTELYQSIIGSANWVINLGRLDIHYATTILSRFINAPREGHLKAAIRILGYLKTFSKGQLIIDNEMPSHVEHEVIEHENWSKFYPKL